MEECEPCLVDVNGRMNACKTVFFGRNINKNYTYSVQSTQLERLEHMKDLGVIFDSELNFVQHCKEKINTAY